MSVKEGNKQRIASYVQTRGSIPLLWTQVPGYAWDPPVEINPDQELNKDAMKKHLEEQMLKYGKLVIIF